jgi:hypothetical protein
MTCIRISIWCKMLQRLFVVPALLFISITALGQATTGSISGRVVDPSGAVVTGANVVITDVNTGIETTSATGKDGEFIETVLPPDRYQVTIAVQGFATTKIATFKLDIDRGPTSTFV